MIETEITCVITIIYNMKVVEERKFGWVAQIKSQTSSLCKIYTIFEHLNT